jgi:hypothetical protein
MHDPFQSYATMTAPYAAGSGSFNPIGIPYSLQTSTINPLAAIHPIAAALLGLSPAPANPINGVPQPALQGYGQYPGQSFINPQQLQLAAGLAQQAAIPQLFGQQLHGQHMQGLLPPGAGLQNPIAAALLGNPFVAAGLQPQWGQQFGQQPHSLYSQFAQGGAGPFGQPGLPAGFGAQLAPQSWVGPGVQPGGLGQASGLGQAYGQIHPLLAQLGARTIQGQGFSPWGY